MLHVATLGLYKEQAREDNVSLLDSNRRVTYQLRLPGFASSAADSMLDTGRHTVIRGNAEYDRYTGEVYDYLNVFPFYLNYARGREVDMPGVEVLDAAGIPLLIDRFGCTHSFQSPQLFQRGVRWRSLEHALGNFSKSDLLPMIGHVGAPPLEEDSAARAGQAGSAAEHTAGCRRLSA